MWQVVYSKNKLQNISYSQHCQNPRNTFKFKNDNSFYLFIYIYVNNTMSVVRMRILKKFGISHQSNKNFNIAFLLAGRYLSISIFLSSVLSASKAFLLPFQNLLILFQCHNIITLYAWEHYNSFDKSTENLQRNHKWNTARRIRDSLVGNL